MRYWTKYNSIELMSPDKSLLLKISFDKNGSYSVEKIEDVNKLQLDIINEKMEKRDENL